MKTTIDVLPPSTNHYLGRGRNGRSYRTQEANDWLSYASSLIRREKRTPFERKVEVYITVNYSKENRDLDNFAKLTLDVLRYANVLKNDNMKYVRAVLIYAGERVKKGKESIELEVREID